MVTIYETNLTSFEIFIAAYIIGGPGVWLYQPIWFHVSDKPGCLARVYHPWNLLLHQSYSRALVYILDISPFPVLQSAIVSFFFLSFSKSLCFIDSEVVSFKLLNAV